MVTKATTSDPRPAEHGPSFTAATLGSTLDPSLRPPSADSPSKDHGIPSTHGAPSKDPSSSGDAETNNKKSSAACFILKTISKLKSFGLIDINTFFPNKEDSPMDASSQRKAPRAKDAAAKKNQNDTSDDIKSPSNWPFAGVLACAFAGLAVDNHQWLSVTSAILIPALFAWLIYSYTHKDIGSVRLSYIWGLLGIFMLIFGIYSDPKHVNPHVTSIIISISGTLISLSIIGVILQLKDTKEYFASTLSDLIMKESYVEKLSRPQLERLQKTVLERYFENPNDFNRENSFYRFFSKNLQNYIGSPYRENYRNTLSIKIIGTNSFGKKECLIIDDLVYRIRSMGDDLQKVIRWKASRDEIKTLKNFNVNIGSQRLFTWPAEQNQESSTDFIEQNFGSDPKGGVEITIFLEKLSQSDQKIRDEYVDGATVKIHAEYISTDYKCITTKLLSPTKGFSLNVFHPAEIRCKIDSYGFDSDTHACEHNNTPQGFSFDYSDWILPLSGVYVAIEPIDILEDPSQSTAGNETHNNNQQPTKTHATEEFAQ